VTEPLAGQPRNRGFISRGGKRFFPSSESWQVQNLTELPV